MIANKIKVGIIDCGFFGYSGKCFSKDVDAFEKMFRYTPLGTLIGPNAFKQLYEIRQFLNVDQIALKMLDKLFLNTSFEICITSSLVILCILLS